jgi:hypothetical protein
MNNGWQLWCYYEAEDVWKMEGFFTSKKEARDYLDELRGDVDTPCMPDWKYVKVEILE